jgi:hypothetical protein
MNSRTFAFWLINYAKVGFYRYIPNIHQGGSLPIDFLQSVEPPLKAPEQ